MEITKRINALRRDIQEGTYSYKNVVAWLVAEGYLESGFSAEDNLNWRPTQRGNQAGINIVARDDQLRAYKAVVFDGEGQKLIMDNIHNILDTLLSSPNYVGHEISHAATPINISIKTESTEGNDDDFFAPV